MRYVFDDFTFDTARYELRHRELARPTAPQVLDLLAYLIEHRHEVVTKENLAAAVWSGRAVSDAAITTRLNVLRSLLGDDGRQQRWIRTFPRKGFRFVGDVHVEGSQPARSHAVASELPSIAVLPFENLSGDPAQDFFGDALADEILTELARLRWLLVIARNSSFTYKGGATDIRAIGADLAVSYVLEGGARRSNGRVRVTCRLVEAKTARQLWSSRYDCTAADGLDVLDEITATVVLQLAPAILEMERARVARLPPESLNIWESCQRGIAQMLRHSAEGCIAARQFFQQAVALKPDYSPGLDGLAWSHLMEASAFGRASITDACHRSEQLTLKALASDPRNASARARLALVLHLRGDNQGAVGETEAALVATPNCADAYGVQGAALVFSGRQPEGRAALENFLKLSPRDPARPIRLSQLAAAFYFETDYENALRVTRQAIRDYPAVPMAYRWMAASLGQLGLTAEGARVVEALQRHHGPSLATYVGKPPAYFRPADHEHLMEGLAKAGWRR